MSEEMVPVGSKVPRDSYRKLRWLAYMNNTTVSAIIADYIARCLAAEDLGKYQAPDR